MMLLCAGYGKLPAILREGIFACRSIVWKEARAVALDKNEGAFQRTLFMAAGNGVRMRHPGESNAKGPVKTCPSPS
jgi:hypothetical protein